MIIIIIRNIIILIKNDKNYINDNNDNSNDQVKMNSK